MPLSLRANTTQPTSRRALPNRLYRRLIAFADRLIAMAQPPH